jgi:hypothetical protein
MDLSFLLLMLVYFQVPDRIGAMSGGGGPVTVPDPHPQAIPAVHLSIPGLNLWFGDFLPISYFLMKLVGKVGCGPDFSYGFFSCGCT